MLPFRRTDTGDFQLARQQHRLVHGEGGIEVVVLQDVAAHFAVLLAAQLGVVHVHVAADAVATVSEWVFYELLHTDHMVEIIYSMLRLRETGEDVEQRRLAGAGRAHDGRQLAGLEAAGDGLQDLFVVCEMRMEQISIHG